MTKRHSENSADQEKTRIKKCYKLVVLLKKCIHEKRLWNNVWEMLNLCLTVNIKRVISVNLRMGCKWGYQEKAVFGNLKFNLSVANPTSEDEQGIPQSQIVPRLKYTLKSQDNFRQDIISFHYSHTHTIDVNKKTGHITWIYDGNIHVYISQIPSDDLYYVAI